MTNCRVILPKTEYEIFEFIQENEHGRATVNIGLRDFEYKVIFPLHLSIMFFLDGDEPLHDESKQLIKVQSIQNKLNTLLIGNDERKPNSLFLANVLWNMSSELVWRIHDVELAKKILDEYFDPSNPELMYDFRMENDSDWKKTEWFLKNYNKNKA